MRVTPFTSTLAVMFIAFFCTTGYASTRNLSTIVYQSSNTTGAFEEIPGHFNCSTSLDQEQFLLKYNEIKGKYFEETRLLLSKELLDHHCLSSAQLKELMVLMSFDKTRMDLAAYAISRVHDPENFAVCKESFAIQANQSYIDELLKEFSANSLKE